MLKKKGYTAMGRRIAGLAKNQIELAEVLGLTQQTISGKMRGTIGVTLSDLKTMAVYYDVPQIYFLMPDYVTADQTRDVSRFIQKDYVNLEMARKGLRKWPVQFWQMVGDEWKKGVPAFSIPGDAFKEVAKYEEMQRS